MGIFESMRLFTSIQQDVAVGREVFLNEMLDVHLEYHDVIIAIGLNHIILSGITKLYASSRSSAKKSKPSVSEPSHIGSKPLETRRPSFWMDGTLLASVS